MRAILITNEDEQYLARLAEVPESDLPAGDVLVEVEYSTLNYKDSLAITGASPVVRTFPMVPGVDLAGTISETTHPEYQVGDRVVLNGWGVGENQWGGYASLARLSGDWLIRIPDRFTTRQAMGIGTAGYTAMLCVMTLEDHGVTPDHGEVLVTGAAGGVGSVAISLLAHLGYTVVASTGRLDESEYLLGIGASEVVDRAELSEPGRPLARERWAGAVDSVGSHTLANVCAATKYGGTVAACGLAQGFDLPATVMPFILRGVTLAGVDSVQCPAPRRREAWNRLATDLDTEHIESITQQVGLEDVLTLAPQQLAGKVRGRVIVDVKQ